jgi:hypothetical protein
MRRSSSWLVAFALFATVGCDGGTQRGRFVVSGSSSHAVTGGAGDLTIVQGDATPLGPQSTGQQPLLYILTLAPNVQASGGGESHSDGSTTSDWKWRWQTPSGEVGIDLSWDRESDRVTAGGTTFDRQRGNAFVLIRDSTGKVSATQLGPIDAGLDMSKALEQIRAALPAGSPASGVALR